MSGRAARPVVAARPVAVPVGLSAGGFVSYSPAEWRSVEPLARKSEEQARRHFERHDLFFCHAWDEREGVATELCDRLVSRGATVWFNRYDVGLGNIVRACAGNPHRTCWSTVERLRCLDRPGP